MSLKKLDQDCGNLDAVFAETKNNQKEIFVDAAPIFKKTSASFLSNTFLRFVYLA